MNVKHFASLVVLALVVGRGTVLSGQSYAEEGAVNGGVAGAIIGGIIGHQNDETAEGALIGGAVGALAGGLLGNDRDQQQWRAYQYQQQQQIRYQNGVSFNDVVVMSQSGVAPHVIINQIQTNGVRQRPSVNDIIGLHQRGVADSVLDAMQRARLATAPYRVRQPRPVVPARPVFIEHYYEPAPVIVHPWPAYGPGIHLHYDHHWHH